MNEITDTIQPIDQHTIECDLRAFTYWLNDLKDQVNTLTKLYYKLSERLDDHENRIHTLENKVSVLEADMTTVKADIVNLKARVTALENSGTGGVIEALNERIDMLYSWLPLPYGMIDPKGWKFAMGNISVMSANNGTASTDGPGIFTSDEIENNDLYFN